MKNIKTEIDGGGASLAQGEGAQFYVPSSLKVKNMDGHSVKWTRRPTANAIAVLLPATTHSFTLDFKESIGNTDYSASNLKVGAANITVSITPWTQKPVKSATLLRRPSRWHSRLVLTRLFGFL